MHFVYVTLLATIQYWVSVAEAQCSVWSKSVTSASGKISSYECRRSVKCVECRWLFPGIPSEDKTLILNMTKKPFFDVRMNGDNFIDDDTIKCKILEKKSRSVDDPQELSEMTLLHSRYPGCKVRSGVQGPVVLSYTSRDPDLPFEIEYHFIMTTSTSSPAFTSRHDTTPTTTGFIESTTATTDSQTSAVLSSAVPVSSGFVTNNKNSSSLTVTTTTPAVNSASFSQSLVIAIAAASLALLLLIGAIVMLLVIRRRRKERSSVAEERMNNLYEDVRHGTIDSRKDKEEVMNPLYTEWGTSDSPNATKPIEDRTPRGSYEYIDIGFNKREARSPL